MSTGTGPEAPAELGGAPRPPLGPQDAYEGGAFGGDAFGGTFDGNAFGGDTFEGDGPEGVVHEREIRPRRRLRWWQTLPIAVIGIFGSLMFAFPLAFESGDGGAVVGMLGLLLTSASVGWGAMAARRVGYAWPGLPRRGSGERASWRAVAAYTLIGLVAIGLAVWRVALLKS
ncbi:DUF1129 domain-containing protein [Peterkaempfera bronchialis]|uniref:Transmembrane protein n=1 Tax=Peterkaempfera bronchialis TaxID=2126346 RepID=A0A345T181_9ACTN|nr:hypothetical protein [Peterkaempfera bronchialis]AXI79736.1 hypothetical protein C7M71_022370 [Peterkaempfera bronchialis]